MPGEPYRRYPVQRHQHKEYLLDGKFVRTLAGTVAEIVAIEGPIHEDLLVERLKEVHGIERAGSNMQANVKQAVAHAGYSDGIERGELNRQFVLKTGVPAKTFRVPGQGVKRPLDLICLEQVEFCILYLVEDQFGMMRDQIPQSVARLFGIERLRGDVGRCYPNCGR